MLIVIGASAGGLSAFKSFIKALPKSIKVPIVFIQHISTDHKGLLPEILKNIRPEFKVVELSDNDSIQTDTIYIFPPHQVVTIEKGIFKLSKPASMESMQFYPIDKFFASVAHEYKDSAIAVILSGTGTDGTRGCEEIYAEEGTVFVQDPTTAEFAGMPESVIQSSVFDQILPPEKIPSEIIKIIEAKETTTVVSEFTSPEQLQMFYDFMYRKTGYRFYQFKKSVISRRLVRRTTMHGLTKIDDYLSLLFKSSQEAKKLAENFMIGVTSFFRNYSEWRSLKDLVVSPLLNKSSAEIIKIWVPGCATGEEAYSIAMILQLEMERKNLKREIQIFASDINERALIKARSGCYLGGVTTDIPPEYLRRFFDCSLDGHSVIVRNEVRKKIIFAKQDVLFDPPFTKLDLIICRNLLIYFTREAQEKCIDVFNYSLKENHYLFLGATETIVGKSNLFSQLEPHSHIFKRLTSSTPPKWPFNTTITSELLTQEQNHPTVRENSNDFYNSIQEAILQIFSPPVLVINNLHEIIYQSGPTIRYIDFTRNPISHNIFDFLPEIIRARLRRALIKVAQNHTTVCLRVNFPLLNRNKIPLTIKVSPVPKNNTLFMIAFIEKELVPAEIESEIDATKIGNEEQAAKESILISQLEKELASTRDDLHRHIDQLRSMNEEIQATNEEIIATNQELETSKEELESTNEELSSVNNQLRFKIDQLESTQRQLKKSELEYKMLAENSPEIIARFDLNFRHLFINDQGAKIYGIPKEEIIGKTISDLGMLTDKATFFHKYFNEVMATGKQQIADYVFFSLNFGRQYLSSLFVPELGEHSKVISILVITRDVTQIKNSELALQSALQESNRYRGQLEAIIKSMHEGIRVYNMQGEIFLINEGEIRLHSDEKLNPSEVNKTNLYLKYELEDQNGRILTKEELPISRVLRGESIYNLELKRKRRDNGQESFLSFNGTPVFDEKGKQIFAVLSTRDITEIKNKEEILRGNEERFRTVVDSIPYSFVIYDPDLKIKYANKTLQQRAEHSLEQMIGKKIDEIFSAELCNLFLPMARKVRETGMPVSAEVNYSLKGKKFYAIPHFVPIKNKKGEIIYIFCLNIDITERKRAEEELKSQKDLLQIIINSIPVMITLYDSTLSKFEINEFQKKTIGWTNEDLQSADIMERIYPDVNARNEAIHFMKSLAPGFKDINIIAKNGDLIETSWANVSLPDGRQIGIGLDIRERKRVAKEIELAAERFKRITSSNIVGCLIADPEGGISFVNDYYLDIIGYEWIDFEQGIINWKDITPPEYLHLDYRAVEQLKSFGIADPYEKQYIRKDGKRRWVYLSDVILPDDKNKIFAFVLDITERKQLEAQLITRAQELEMANKELQSFSYSVTHDLRNPLNITIGLLDILLHEVKNYVPQKYQEYLTIIRCEIERMNAIIDDMLALYRISHQEMEIKEVDLSKMANFIINELKVTQPDRKVEIVIQEKLKDKADFRLVNVILRNLLGNSWKYTGKNSSSRIEFGALRKDKENVYFVRDNGIGFDMGQVEKLFVPFSRLHSRKEFPGTGIGLAIVERAIYRHGGKIWAESEPGKVTTFYFTLGR